MRRAGEAMIRCTTPVMTKPARAKRSKVGFWAMRLADESPPPIEDRPSDDVLPVDAGVLLKIMVPSHLSVGRSTAADTRRAGTETAAALLDSTGGSVNICPRRGLGTLSALAHGDQRVP